MLIYKSYYTYSDIVGIFLISSLVSVCLLSIIINNFYIVLCISTFSTFLFSYFYMYNFYKIVLVYDNRFHLYYPISKKTKDYYPIDIKKVEYLYVYRRGRLIKVTTNKNFFTFEVVDVKKGFKIIELAKLLGIQTINNL